MNQDVKENRAEDRVKQIAIVLIVLRITNFIVVMIAANQMNVGISSTNMINIIVTIIVCSYLYTGRKWPLYLYAVGIFLGFIGGIKLMEFFGEVNGVIDIIIVYTWIDLILISGIIIYAFTNANITEYFQAMKKERIENKLHRM